MGRESSTRRRGRRRPKHLLSLDVSLDDKHDDENEPTSAHLLEGMGGNSSFLETKLHFRREGDVTVFNMTPLSFLWQPPLVELLLFRGFLFSTCRLGNVQLVWLILCACNTCGEND